jgi:hypothetical protein
VLLFAFAVSILTGVIFGLVPALRASRPDLANDLKERGSTSGGLTRLWAPRSMLVMAQVALSLVIVVAAGLFVRTFEKLAALPLGFDSERVLLVNVNLSRTRVAADDRLPFATRLSGDAANVPGVVKSAASLITPVGGMGLVEMIRRSDAPASFEVMTNGKLNDNAAFANYITPGFFATYGTPIKAGRDFSDSDTKGAAAAIIVVVGLVVYLAGGRRSGSA